MGQWWQENIIEPGKLPQVEKKLGIKRLRHAAAQLDAPDFNGPARDAQTHA